MKKILLLAILLAIMPLVFAATDINSPAINGSFSGTINLTVTTDMADTDNCTFWYNVTSDAMVFMVTIQNDTPGQLVFESETFDVSGFGSYVDYNITVNCTDIGATAEEWGSIRDVTIDNTNPTCTLKKDHNTMPWKGVQYVKWGSADDLSLTGTAITIDRPERAADLTYTDASRELTLTSQDTKYIGDWTFSLTARDRPNNTATCNETWKTYLPDGEEWEPEPEPEGIPGWAILAIIGVIGYFILKRK